MLEYRPRMADGLIALIILSTTVIIYLQLPKAGDIWWSDASGHALNGAFVLDFLRAMPIHHPVEFAIAYYRQWPGLTIGFYPPLFYVALATSYAIFGVSEAAALVPQMVSLFVLGWGVYRLSRNWLDNTSALAVVLMTIGAPQIAFWGQQIMLDVPAYACLIWAAVFHLRYLKTEQPRSLYYSMLFVVAAIYTKYNAAFFVGVMVLSLLFARSWRSMLRRNCLRAAALGFFLLAPLLIVFFEVSSFNLSQAFSLQSNAAPRWSLVGLTYYARIMPAVVSWPTTVLAIGYCFCSLIMRQFRLPKLDTAFLLIWLMFGYVFYALIAVKEPRHILFITYPVMLAATLLLRNLAARFSWGPLPVVAFAAAVMVYSLITNRPPYVTGARQAALYIGKVAPEETNVAFWGAFESPFIYSMRAYSGRSDLGIIRLNKFLVSYTLGPRLGFTQKNLNAQEIVDELRGLHVQYVIVQTGYGEEIDVVKNLNMALGSDKFRVVNRIEMRSNWSDDFFFENYPDPFITGDAYITHLVVYRAVEEMPKGRVAPPMNLGLIGRSL